MTFLHEKTGKGIHAIGNFARVIESWGENEPAWKKEIEVTLGSVFVSEYTARNGPSPHKLFTTDVPDVPAKSPTSGWFPFSLPLSPLSLPPLPPRLSLICWMCRIA